MLKLQPWLKFIEGEDGGAGTDTTTDDTSDEQGDQDEDSEQVAGSAWESLFQGEDPKKVREQLDHAREWERRAKANKEAADELAALKAAQSTHEEDPDVGATSEAELVAIRYKVALENGLSREDADLFLTDVTEEGMTAQAKRFAEVSSSRRSKRTSPDTSRDRTPPTPTLKSGADLYDRVKTNLY